MVFVWRECIDWSGREREKEGGSEGEWREGEESIIHLNTPETPNSFIYLGENLVCRYLQQEFVSEFKKKRPELKEVYWRNKYSGTPL